MRRHRVKYASYLLAVIRGIVRNASVALYLPGTVPFKPIRCTSLVRKDDQNNE